MILRNQQNIKHMAQQNQRLECFSLINIINNKIVIDEEAANKFASCNGPFSIVSACGQYRTGKSFLLNTMFRQTCFDVSPTTIACTKGINMVSRPLQLNGKKIWILDTEGFGSLQQQGNYDAKIFLLTILVSELVIYNSVGSLDQVSLQTMAAMCKKAETLAKAQKIKDNQAILNKDTQLCWTIRDFSLSLVNKDGIEINGDQYLQEALNQSSRDPQPERKAIKKMFKQRRCFPLVRPCISQQDLQSLKNIQAFKLRQQFVKQVEKIRNYIIEKVNYKTIFGNFVNGAEFVGLLKCYVQMINEQNFQCSMAVTWEQILEHQRQILLAQAQCQISQKIKQSRKLLPLKVYEFMRLSQQIQAISKNIIGSKSINMQQSIRLDIQKIKHTILGKIDQQNKQKVSDNCLQHAQDSLRQMICRVQKSFQTDYFSHRIEDQIQRLKGSYLQKFKDFQKEVVDAQFCKMLQKIISWITRILTEKLEQLAIKQTKQLQMSKIINELKQSLEIHISAYQEAKNKLAQMEIMYKNSLESINNYIQVVARMEKVTDTLRNQFQMLQQSDSISKLVYEEKVREYSYKLEVERQKEQLLLQSLKQLENKIKKLIQQEQNLKDQIQYERQVHEKQMKAVRKQCQAAIQAERSQFQKIIYQKSIQLSFMQQQMARKQADGQKNKEQILSQMRHLNMQYQQRAKTVKFKHAAQLQQLKQTKKLVNLDLQRLKEQVVDRDVELERRNQQMRESQQKHKNQILELQQKISQFKQQIRKLQEDNEQLMNLNEGLMNQNKQQATKLKIAKQELSQLRAKAKSDIEALSQKLHEGLKNNASSSQLRFAISKRELEVEREKIASKLVEAAKRIQQMTEKQKQQLQQIEELSNYNQKLKIQIQSLKSDEENGRIQNIKNTKLLQFACEEALSQNTQLKKIIERQDKKIKQLRCKLHSWLSKKDNSSMQEEIEREAEIKNKNSQGEQQQSKQNKIQQISISKLKSLVNKYEKQNRKLKSQLKRLKHIKQGNSNSVRENPENAKNQDQQSKTTLQNKILRCQATIIQLQQQNQQLNTKIKICQNQAEKWHSGALKKLNLHSAMKKLKQNDSFCIQSTVGLQINRQENNTQKYIGQMLNQMQQLRKLILIKNEEINELQQRIRQKQQEIRERQKEHIEKRIKCEQKIATMQIQMKKNVKTIGQMHKRIKQLQQNCKTWKSKAMHVETVSQSQQRQTAYKQRIKEMFMNL